ncbi:hypothetical protein [Granulicella tundricola]|uniref:Uncharacterized protein n=1 Tax=Granulicella tundricola (strain ATCC BAA-1859 / DSM 23138 / MP5ACTX9) TaxID=1198114 RepID=E8X815_GRATM|nr:hypothetical protein [Granulicella tundricola]ADW71599.1 hypothetical protein AciX9_4669 [Granulicella tundricola MP5ACTX9]
MLFVTIESEITMVALMTLFLAASFFGNKPSRNAVTEQSIVSDKSVQAKQPDIVDLPIVPSGASRVWLDTARNHYRCSYERQYGKSKTGEYLTEKEARDKGARPFNKRGCPSR